MEKVMTWRGALKEIHRVGTPLLAMLTLVWFFAITPLTAEIVKQLPFKVAVNDAVSVLDSKIRYDQAVQRAESINEIKNLRQDNSRQFEKLDGKIDELNQDIKTILLELKRQG